MAGRLLASPKIAHLLVSSGRFGPVSDYRPEKHVPYPSMAESRCLFRPMIRDERANVGLHRREPRESFALAEPRAAKRPVQAVLGHPVLR